TAGPLASSRTSSPKRLSETSPAVVVQGIRLFPDDRVPQNTDALEFDFEHVARLDFVRRARRPGEDQVARTERHVLTDEADGARYIVDHVARPFFLLHLAVLAEREL